MRKDRIFLFIVLLVHLFILSKLQFTAWPEMVSFPYLLNHGFINYKDMVHAYPTLLVSILSVLYKIFGYKLIVLEIFGWTSFLINDLLIFSVINKLTKKNKIAIASVIGYVVLQTILEGNMVWPDLIMIPFLLSGLLFLINKNYLFSGILYALALLTKQTAAFYIAFSVLYIVFTEKRIKSIASFFAGGLIIGLPFLFTLITQNSLNYFINWTIIYPSKYWTKFPSYVQLTPSLRANIILLVLFLPLAYLIFKSARKIFYDKNFLLLFAFLICGIVGIYPRFSFFHFQPAIPFLVILVSYLVTNMKKGEYVLLCISFLVLILSFSSLQFGTDRFWSDDRNMGMIVKRETSSDKPVYLLGLNSDIYAFSERLPNKPWLDNFGWYLEIPGTQEKVISSFESNPPDKIFWRTPDVGNWYDIGSYQPKKITNYILEKYSKKKEITKGVWEWTRN